MSGRLAVGVSMAILAAAARFGSTAAAAASFTYTKLDIAGEYLTSASGFPQGQNNKGVIVGAAYSAPGQSMGFVRNNGVVTFNHTCIGLNVVSSRGRAAGFTANAGEYCTVDLNGTTRTYPVHTTGITSVLIDGINTAGTVIAQNEARSAITNGLILQGDKTTAFSVPGSAVKYGGTYPTGINASGTIAGYYAATAQQTGFTLTNGSFATFAVPNAAATLPFAIADDGTICGTFLVPGPSRQQKAFVMRAGRFTVINPPGAVFSTANAIGPHGDVIGTWWGASGLHHGFIYRAGTYLQIDFPSGAGTTLTSVNAAGALLGTFFDSQSNAHPFLAQCAPGQVCTQ